MKILTIFVSLVAIVSARPNASHMPSGSYLPPVNGEKKQLPSGSYLPPVNGEKKQLPSGSYLPPTPGGKDSLSHNQEEDETHVYFYASPNDAFYTHYNINIAPNTKKNTKVIFVKAPHHAGVIPNVVTPSSSIEDKTLVYVLVKKPIDGQSISLPANLGIKQAKPEVFFIKYNEKQEAEALVNNGIKEQDVGVTVPELPNQFAFVNALETDQEHGYHYGPKSTNTDSNKTTVAIDEPTVHVEIKDDKEDLPIEDHASEVDKPNTITDIKEINNGIDHLNATDDNCDSKDETPTILDIGDGFETNGPPT